MNWNCLAIIDAIHQASHLLEGGINMQTDHPNVEMTNGQYLHDYKEARTTET